VPLETLKHTPGLEKMMVIRKGSRLSVQPVTEREYEIVASMGRAASSQPAESPRSKGQRSKVRR
jgi:predicted RNA-binding protein with PUA-like domain